MQLSDRVLVMTYRPGRLKRVVDIDLPHPRDSEVVSSDAFGHYVAEIWHDLRDEASRGIKDDESRVLQQGAQPMTPVVARPRALARASFGVVTTIAAIAVVELLIRAGVINRFIVPLPSEIVAAIPRIVVEEHVLHRFWQTTQEVLWASLLLDRRRHLARGAALSLPRCCASPANRGSARSPRPRSCSCTRCSWSSSAAARRRS